MKKYKAVFITTDGEEREEEREKIEYEEMKKFVGGLVQIVPMPSGKSIIINDEGKLIGLDRNDKATEIWKKEYPIAEYPDNNDELIVGNAIIVDDELVN